MNEITNDEILSVIFEGMPSEERAVLCSVAGDPSTVERWPGQPWRMGQPCPLREDRNNYTTVSSFVKGDGGGWRRRKDQFAGLYAIMVDDIGTKIEARSLPRELRPTLLVETSPGNYQAVIKLSEPIRDIDLATDLIARMIEVLAPGGVDPGMAGVTRVMRLPGGINGKPKYVRDGAIWRCQVARWKPDVTMSLEELVEVFALVRHTRVFYEPVDAVARERKRSFEIVAQALDALGRVKRKGKWIDIRCPWIGDHTDRSDTGSAVALPMGANGFMGGYRCHHGHCQDRGWADLEEWAYQQVMKQGNATRGPFTGA